MPRIIVERDVSIAMRDGIRLKADVYRPARGGRYPVLLSRTHYGRRTAEQWVDPVRSSTEGFVVVINDMRGQYGSEGVFDPFTTDDVDGYDVVEWCGHQPWSNGKVAMYGSSSSAFSQLLAASRQPPSLRALAPMQTWTSFGRGNIYTHGGAFTLFSQWWALTQAQADPEHQIRPHFSTVEEYERHRDGIADALKDMERWHLHLPLTDLPPLSRQIAPYFYRWVERPSMDEGWAALDISTRFDRINLPGLHVAGWLDRFGRDTIQNFMELRRRTTAAQHLVIGPWPHGIPVIVGDEFGDEARIDARDLLLRFCDRWLRDRHERWQEEPAVRLFVMGANQWRAEEQWPPRGSRTAPLHLRSLGRANAHTGGGSLTAASAEDEPADTYRYDPFDPTPTDPALLARSGYSARGLQPHQADERDDVLVYDSDPLHRPVTVIGPVTLLLWASSSAENADWVATVADVRPDGRVWRITDGMIRASYREGTTRPVALEPGRVYRYEIRLRPMAYRFGAGHRLRLEVSSGSFPAFDRNLGRVSLVGATSGVVAEQRVYHDAARPSQLLISLPPDQPSIGMG